MTTIQKLQQLMQAQRIRANDEGFVLSLLRFAQIRGTLTTGQDNAAQRLIARYEQRATPQASTASTVPTFTRVDLSPIVRMFDAARAHGLRRASIRLGNGLKVSAASPTSANPGAIYVKRDGDYLGKITSEGREFFSPSMTSAEKELVREFAQHPLERATVYGHATGQCCFCGRELTDARSVAMGYGPICADHYGLDWGHQRAAQSVDVVDDVRTQAA